MKRAIFALTALSALVGGAVAQQPKMPPIAVPKTIKCPVMPTNKVDIAKATKKKMYTDYKGRRYYFCCDGCPQAFKASPAKYAKRPSLPAPKKGK